MTGKKSKSLKFILMSQSSLIESNFSINSKILQLIIPTIGITSPEEQLIVRLLFSTKMAMKSGNCELRRVVILSIFVDISSSCFVYYQENYRLLLILMSSKIFVRFSRIFINNSQYSMKSAFDLQLLNSCKIYSTYSSFIRSIKIEIKEISTVLRLS